MPTISAGSSQTFTAGVKDQLFTLTANGGALGTVTGAVSASFGPGAERRSFGPFAVGQAITVTVQAGSVIVEYGDSTPEMTGPANGWLSGTQVAAGAVGLAGMTAEGTIVGPFGGASAYVGPQLLTVTVGNSINAAANQSGSQRNNSAGADPAGWWNTGSEVHFANALCDSPLRFGRITATTRADKWGNYAYSGQQLATINGDLTGQLFGALDTASIRPDVIIAVDLLANDIGAGRTYSQCVADLRHFIYLCQGRYPTARLIINTPHPSFSYDTAAKVLVYQQMRDYILALDDGRKIFASRTDLYEDSANPGKPLAGFTDASVHPTTAGGTMIARFGMLPTLRRVVQSAFPAYRCSSLNFAATGTGAASGTNVTGTVPTGYIESGSATATSIVVSADQPGCTRVLTQAAGLAFDSGSLECGGQHVISGTVISPYLKIRINSGAENLRGVFLQPRPTDGTTSPFFLFGSAATADGDPAIGAYQNGDVLTLRCPPFTQADAGTAGALTTCRVYLRMLLRTNGTANVLGGSASVTVLDSGLGLVS